MSTMQQKRTGLCCALTHGETEGAMPMCAFTNAPRVRAWPVLWLAVLTATAGAQDTRAFSVGYTSVGPTIGVIGLHDADVAFGARLEQGVKALPGFGNGVLGVQVSADSYEVRPPSGGTPSRYVPVAVTANYHFILIDRRLDPFIGAGIGYRFASASNEGAGEGADRASFLGHAGVRWVMTALLSLYAEAGTVPPKATSGIMLVFR
jgi:hypothetical protein